MNVTTHRTRVFIRAHHDTKILVMIRSYGKDKVLLLPGGGVDEGETAEQSMLREVHEELGIRLVASKLIYEHKGTRKITEAEKKYWPNATYVTNHFDFFEATMLKGDKPILKEPEKFDCFDWIEPKEITSYAKKHGAEISDGILITSLMLSKNKKTLASAW